MSEDERPEAQAAPVVKVARDLTEILTMHAALHAQAVAKATDSLMPGGHAMVALGNVANMEAWENRQQATERHLRGIDGYRKAYTSAEDEDPDEAWSAFQLLEFWSEQWRAEHGSEYDKRPTITTEAAFIRWCLPWAWDNEIHWDEFAADIRQARLRLETVLYAGTRAERTRVVCDQCQDAPQLIVQHGRGDTPDSWKCPTCKHRFDQDGLQRAHAKQLRHEAAARYVDQGDAVATLRAQGRSERTVRKWLSPLSPLDQCEVCAETWPHQEHAACPKVRADGDQCGGMLTTIWHGDREAVVEGYCEIGTKRRLVWWPDLWRKHLGTATRKRDSA